VRIAGPGHTPEQLAKIAYRKHVRLARLEGGALGLGGIITAAPDVVALLWIQSRMVFYIAAASGYDPRHPMRPAELLALQEVYATPAEARAALDGMGKLMAQAIAEKALASRNNDRLHRRLLKYIAKRMARKYAGRYVPLIGAPLGAMQNAGVTKDLGRRTLAYYARP
jgi:EcsC protein family